MGLWSLGIGEGFGVGFFATGVGVRGSGVLGSDSLGVGSLGVGSPTVEGTGLELLSGSLLILLNLKTSLQTMAERLQYFNYNLFLQVMKFTCDM